MSRCEDYVLLECLVHLQLQLDNRSKQGVG